MTLVTLEAAIAHLRQIAGQDDAEIGRKLAEAEAWAVDVMGTNSDPTWTDLTVPDMIRSAILLRLSALYNGATDGKEFDVADRLIERWRDRTIA